MLYLQRKYDEIAIIMKIIGDIMDTCKLFENIKPGDAEKMLACLGARRKRYPKDSFVFMAGDEATHFGLLLSGRLLIIHEDFWGNRNIVEHIQASNIFGAAYVFSDIGRFPVTLQSTENSEVLLFSGKKLSMTCSSACIFHTQIIANMLNILSQNNITLVKTLDHISRRSTREKLLSYFSACAFNSKSAKFTIPFDRQELADYLAVERSSMSAELGRMKKDGLLEYHKNQFFLKKDH
ncbi:MAG: Crp/Fnr family transcriptional regulator [Treponema sp.]|jgi:CRP-like cAMP-binding protein|nr:Crp/Fnr family transcriptional regulator [Treponema sp.]